MTGVGGVGDDYVRKWGWTYTRCDDVYRKTRFRYVFGSTTTAPAAALKGGVSRRPRRRGRAGAVDSSLLLLGISYSFASALRTIGASKEIQQSLCQMTFVVSALNCSIRRQSGAYPQAYVDNFGTTSVDKSSMTSTCRSAFMRRSWTLMLICCAFCKP